MDYQIGFDDKTNKYFVYDLSGKEIYRGTYTQCLIIVGGMSLGDTFEESKKYADLVHFSN